MQKKIKNITTGLYVAVFLLVIEKKMAKYKQIAMLLVDQIPSLSCHCDDS